MYTLGGARLPMPPMGHLRRCRRTATGRSCRCLQSPALVAGAAVPGEHLHHGPVEQVTAVAARQLVEVRQLDRKSTRLNSSHQIISYAVFCLKKKKNKKRDAHHTASAERL